WVRLSFQLQGLALEVEDHGSGLTLPPKNRGIGLVAMRERAQLLGGQIDFTRPAQGGTLVRLTVPKERPDSNA
ncbi:MAG TPA: ATP-binding protein, partial [Terriglobales bacterium]|nr:ATP-binding protein [Terriglobales bacterium]